MIVRTRFAPSPTGFLHVGGARTALFNWLFSCRHGGVFVLRFEDTDTERSTSESIEQILVAMKWLGLEADEGPFFQMQRLDHYKRLASQLLESGKAYSCYCSQEELTAMREEQKGRGLKPRYDGRCKERKDAVPDVSPVLRLANPASGIVKVHDLVHGDVNFDNSELDDLIILRSDGVPTYNFSVVVDDYEMNITHVIRGDDHLNNTPRQLNIMNALGIKPPYYAHLPMIMGADHSRLSKRHGAMSVLGYRDAGYLPEAMLNYIARLGWSHGDQELFSIEEMKKVFNLEHVHSAAGSFDEKKCQWVNEQWLKLVSTDYLAESLVPFLQELELNLTLGPSLEQVTKIQRERVSNLREMATKSLFIYRELESYEPKAAMKHLRPEVRDILQSVAKELLGLGEWTENSTQIAVEVVAEELAVKMGVVAQPLRVAVTGSDASPGIGQTLALLGREKTLARIQRAIEYISVQSSELPGASKK
ncbi:MAG: glutamate--tRNA ligase [Pseudomonadota bacterium]|nr:glutamate--tRNA ligase [Pseudomonadota bacterium]